MKYEIQGKRRVVEMGEKKKKPRKWKRKGDVEVRGARWRWLAWGMGVVGPHACIVGWFLLGSGFCVLTVGHSSRLCGFNFKCGCALRESVFPDFPSLLHRCEFCEHK